MFQIYLKRFKNELNYPEKMFSVNLDNGLFDIVFLYYCVILMKRKLISKEHLKVVSEFWIYFRAIIYGDRKSFIA